MLVADQDWAEAGRGDITGKHPNASRHTRTLNLMNTWTINRLETGSSRNGEESKTTRQN
jgi:hypothetical protein